MKKIRNILKNTKGNVAGGIIGFILGCCLIYGIYWLAKTVSYNLFYEDMVRQTITEMVKKDSLK